MFKTISNYPVLVIWICIIHYCFEFRASNFGFSTSPQIAEKLRTKGLSTNVYRFIALKGLNILKYIFDHFKESLFSSPTSS